MKLTPAVILVAGLSVLAGPRMRAVPPGGEAATGHGAAQPTAQATADAQNAIKNFQHEAGLKIDLFATEPLLANPVAFTQDEKGRWYIAETYRQERGVEDNRAHGNWLD